MLGPRPTWDKNFLAQNSSKMAIFGGGKMLQNSTFKLFLYETKKKRNDHLQEKKNSETDAAMEIDDQDNDEGIGASYSIPPILRRKSSIYLPSPEERKHFDFKLYFYVCSFSIFYTRICRIIHSRKHGKK